MGITKASVEEQLAVSYTPSPNNIRVQIGPGRENVLFPYISEYCDGEAFWEGAGTVFEFEWKASGSGWNVTPHPMVEFDYSMQFVRFVPKGSPSNVENPIYVFIRARNSSGWGDWSYPIPVNIDNRKP